MPVPSRRSRLTTAVPAAVAATLGLAAAPLATATDPDAAAPTAVSGRAVAEGPVLDRNFPDPDLVESRGVYHAYATNGDGKNVQRATSGDLREWTVAESDPLPALGAWAKPEQTLVWAPEVFANGDGFTMYYTARDRASDKQCIGAARSSSPAGPFRPVGDGPLVCPSERGGAIDAAEYTENGRRYMLWKNDGNCCEQDTWLHLQPVGRDGTRVTGEPVRLIKQDRDWEGELIEAPTLVKRNGRYVLFYSADFYGDERYKSGYAVADSLTGPYTKAPDPLMTTESFGGAVRGPGGQDVVTGPDGKDRMVFHGWNAEGTRRAMYVADLGWADGRPVVRGSQVRYEAEEAEVHNAVIRDAVGASGGRAVGKIDRPDSHVEFTVFAASAGAHTFSVRFGNGSLDEEGTPVGASHGLTVNDAAAGEVRYPYTGWNNWRRHDVTVRLHEGWNTVRLTKGDRYAELDTAEVG